MTRVTHALTQLRCQLTARWARLRTEPDRGDVPGWVMITIMTAGIVLAIWAVAGPELSSLFSDAIHSVVGGP